ncbi:ABC transporter permease [Demequina salsinemoris]|uniref:ABC transporter permease n=1 Tax=Demequina salsinemoris TaxID=577470 RepID=UPI0007853A50|nr:ABC transporter permease [Demequina salsinemoris]
MLTFIVKRIGFAAVTLLVASGLVFLLMHLSPTTPGVVALGTGGTPETIQEYNESIGWYDPLFVQYLRWLADLVQGDLGTSLTDGRDIATDIGKRLPVTAAVAAGAVLLSSIVGIALGVTAAVRRGIADRMVTAMSGIFISIPQFWLGIVLVFVFAVQLGLLPASGFTRLEDDPAAWFRSLLLPVLTLSVGSVGFIARQTRASMVEALTQEHIRTLRAVGTPTWRILYVHALRYASLPIVAGISIQFIGLFGGSVIIEQLFNLPGVGLAMQQAVGYTDVPFVQALVVVATLVVVIVNLLLEISNKLLDPKLRAS